MASAAIIERLAERKGARVLAVDGVNNGDSPEAQLMRTLIDAFAQYERALIRSRMVQALGHKKARGERVGAVPYGKQVAADGRRWYRASGIKSWWRGFGGCTGVA